MNKINLRLFLNSYKSLPFNFKAIFILIYLFSLLLILLESISISLIVPLVNHLSGTGEINNFFFLNVLKLVEKFHYFGGDYLNFKNYGTKLVFSILFIYLFKFILSLFQVYLLVNQLN